MKYVLRLNYDLTIDVLEFNDDHEFKWFANQIGCEWIEVVHPKYSKYSLVIDEEGRLKPNYINLLASAMYGTFEHGEPIVGNVLLMKEELINGEYDLTGFSLVEANKIKEELEEEKRSSKLLGKLL